MRVKFWPWYRDHARERDIQAVIQEHLTKIRDTLHDDYQLCDAEIIRRIREELPCNT